MSIHSAPRCGVPQSRPQFESLFQAPPTFFVVGAQKAGTSSLHELLVRLPRTSLPDVKETHFFDRDEYYRRGPGWYRKRFSRDRPRAVCGEVDPEYLFSPAAAGRIAAAAPQARIVAILREPLSRALSHWRMSKRRGLETLPFVEALRREPERLGDRERGREARIHFSYVERGLYASQIAAYCERFARENLLFVRFEDLVGDGARQGTVLRILEHVGLEIGSAEVPSLERSNSATEPRMRALSRLLHRDSPLKRMVRPWLPFRGARLRFAMAVDRWNRRPVTGDSDEGNHPIPGSIVARVARDVSATQALTGLDLSAWLESYR